MTALWRRKPIYLCAAGCKKNVAILVGGKTPQVRYNCFQRSLSLTQSMTEHTSSSVDEFQPAEVIWPVLKGWWIAAVLIILGGLAGLGIHALRPTQYEAVFSLTTTIDLSNTGELSQYEEDIALEAVGAAFYKDSTLEQVAKLAQQAGIQTDAVSLKANSTIERKLSTWLVRVRSHNPQTADGLASLWLKTGLADLNTSYQHALTAGGLQRYLNSLESCLAQSVPGSPAPAQCSQGNLAAIQAELGKTGTLLADERYLSNGVITGLLVPQAQTELAPARVVMFQQGQMVLAGMLIGFLAAVWLLQTHLLARLLKRKQRG